VQIDASCNVLFLLSVECSSFTPAVACPLVSGKFHSFESHSLKSFVYILTFVFSLGCCKYFFFFHSTFDKMKFNFGAVIPLLALGNAFVIRIQGPLATTRLDPIISPGKVAGHEHMFLGGNSLKADLGDFSSAQHCTCTTAEVTPDCSLYWFPPVFGRLPNNTYAALPLVDASAYYFDVGFIR
jgi:hypothetical protein